MAEDLRFDQRMPRWLHVRLVNYLQTTMRSPADCHGLDRTRAFVDAHHGDVDAAIAWLAEHDAECDCEVILNTNPAYWTDAVPGMYRRVDDL